MKDVFGHEAGRKIEFGSRLCAAWSRSRTPTSLQLFRAAGLNIIGARPRPSTPCPGTTEGRALRQHVDAWRKGYSAGGSSGGSMAAVVVRHVADRARHRHRGSIRIPGKLLRRRGA
jgi:amidase